MQTTRSEGGRLMGATSPRREGRAAAIGGVLCAAICAAICLLSTSGAQAKDRKAAQEVTGAARTRALLLNGGGNPKINFLSHFHHLQDMMGVLVDRGIPKDEIVVFSSDGEDRGEDLTTQSVEKTPKGFWLIGGTAVGDKLTKGRELEDTRWEGVKLRPARHEALRGWFKEQGEALKAGDTLLIFVTDHGRKGEDDPDNGTIVLWDEDMTVLEFKALLGYLDPGVRVVTIMSQCFSGTFGASIYGLGEELPQGNGCGFFATRNDRLAYGCYPEGRGRDQIGHAFQFIDAMRAKDALADAQAQVRVYDDTPDVPLSTSDLFLERRLEVEGRDRGQSAAAVADRLLARAWEDPARWSARLGLIDELGAAYGLYSPRSVVALDKEAELSSAVIKAADETGDAWKRSYDELLQANLDLFLGDKANASWRPRLEPQALGQLNEGGRQKLLTGLLPALERFAEGNGDILSRLKDMRAKRSLASKVMYRAEIRQAVQLRMRLMLVRIAGELLLEDPGAASMTEARRRAAREALDKLVRCESWSPGRAPGGGSPKAPEALPLLVEELEGLRQSVPSRLGISFEEAPQEVIAQHKLGRGAVRVTRVLPDSSASRAGLRLDDVVIGPGMGAAMFTHKDQIRTWTMTAPNDKEIQLHIVRGGKLLILPVRLDPFDIEIPKAPPTARIGAKAPSLSLPGLGEIAAPGERVGLFFWSTSCEACRRALPEVMAWGARTGTRLIAISDEPASRLAAFGAGAEGTLPQAVVSDPTRESFAAFGVTTAPTLALIDARGQVRFVKAIKAGEVNKLAGL